MRAMRCRPGPTAVYSVSLEYWSNLLQRGLNITKGAVMSLLVKLLVLTSLILASLPASALANIVWA